MPISIDNYFSFSKPSNEAIKNFNLIVKALNDPRLKTKKQQMDTAKSILAWADSNGFWKMGQLGCSLNSYVESTNHGLRERAVFLISQAEKSDLKCFMREVKSG